MPIYVFNKLVRDNLVTEYEKLNQKATYRKLSDVEFAKALKQKLIEEIGEIDPNNTESVINELADVYQVVEDIINLYEITPEQIGKVKQAKFEKKGGFSKAAFVETLELSDDDEWNEYYRKEPEIFIELSKKE